MKDTLIIAGYPGVGKTCYNKNNIDRNCVIMDSDSSKFSWILGEDGKPSPIKERNPKFPDNYINHIKEYVGRVDIIFVSTHKQVLQSLIDAGIQFYIIAPNITEQMKDLYLTKYINRGSEFAFVKLMADKWEEFHIDIANFHTKYDIPVFYLNERTPHITKSIIEQIKTVHKIANHSIRKED